VVLEGDDHVKHEVDCPFCHSTFIPRQKGVNRLLQTLLIMAILAAISVTVLVFVNVVNPQSGIGFGLMLLLLFGAFVGLWYGGRAVYMHLIWRDPDVTEESLDLSRFTPPARQSADDIEPVTSGSDRDSDAGDTTAPEDG